jgi:hypothetical protein
MWRAIRSSVRFHYRRRPAWPEALKILEQFIQLKGVTDGVHDSVLQH